MDDSKLAKRCDPKIFVPGPVCPSRMPQPSHWKKDGAVVVVLRMRVTERVSERMTLERSAMETKTEGVDHTNLNDFHMGVVED